MITPKRVVRRTVTNRSQLLRSPTDGDDCSEYTEEPGTLRDCGTDGHYLCAGCARLTADPSADWHINRMAQ